MLRILSLFSNNILTNGFLYFTSKRFWMHPNLISMHFVGIGMAHSLQKDLSRFSSKKFYPQARSFILSIPVILSAHSLMQGMIANDQSENYHFRNYASSILTSLPLNSTLFINYDQQWTSVRYLQECEGVRQDVTSIHLGMMSYEWWQHKRQLYPKLAFPGTHYAQANTVQWKEGGFTFSELLDSNYGSSDIFIGGKVSFPELIYFQAYEEVPHGIVSRIVKKEDTSTTPEGLRRESKHTWDGVIEKYADIGLPHEMKYRADSWEHTITREFFHHFVQRANHLLDVAVQESDDPASKVEVLPALAEACAWLEFARLNDEMSEKSPSLWKNLGLGYMAMVRSKGSRQFPMTANIVPANVERVMSMNIDGVWWDATSSSSTDTGSSDDWKTWASHRWEKTWRHFLQMDGAKNDESYDAVKSMFDAVMKATRKTG